MKVLATLLLLLLAAASGQAAIDDRFAEGETLDYSLRWGRITGGAARMTIAPIDDERYRITSIGKSSAFFSRVFRVRDELESIVKRENFSTVQFRKLLDERGRKKDELTVIDPVAGSALRKGKTIPVPNPVFDPISLMYYIRKLDLATGHTHEFTILADGKIYTLQAVVLGRESVTTPAGTFKTVVVEPKMLVDGVYRKDQHRLLIWYSDDADRLPVRIRSDVNFGSITATLRRASRGVTATEPVTGRDE